MSTPPPDFDDSDLMNCALRPAPCALRMVIPMRREFGRARVVQRLLHNPAYARDVLGEACNSRNPKLREYAEYLSGKLLGPRTSSTPAPAVTQRLASRAEAQAAADRAIIDKADDLSAEEEARQRMLAKYRSGLR